MQRAFVANAAFVVNNIFNIAKGTALGRICVTFLVFIISGVMHVIGVRMIGPTCQGGPVFRYYCLMALGIVFEDLVRQLYLHSVVGNMGTATSRLLGRAVGYLWTFLFMSWTLPKLFFPNEACADG